MATDDVYTQKKAFIEGQVRRLTTTLAPSREFKSAAASSSVEDKDRLSETVVDNAVYKCTHHVDLANSVNLAMRKQNRLQYSTQAIRHVSTQITELYRARLDADRETGIQGGESATLLDILSGRADFTDPK
jgi:glutamate racemase